MKYIECVSGCDVGHTLALEIGAVLYMQPSKSKSIYKTVDLTNYPRITPSSAFFFGISMKLKKETIKRGVKDITSISGCIFL